MPVCAPESLSREKWAEWFRAELLGGAGSRRDRHPFSPLFTWMAIRSKCFTRTERSWGVSAWQVLLFICSLVIISGCTARAAGTFGLTCSWWENSSSGSWGLASFRFSLRCCRRWKRFVSETHPGCLEEHPGREPALRRAQLLSRHL